MAQAEFPETRGASIKGNDRTRLARALSPYDARGGGGGCRGRGGDQRPLVFSTLLTDLCGQCNMHCHADTHCFSFGSHFSYISHVFLSYSSSSSLSFLCNIFCLDIAFW